MDGYPHSDAFKYTESDVKLMESLIADCGEKTSNLKGISKSYMDEAMSSNSGNILIEFDDATTL